ncbi:hypothetical protein HZP84_15785 [Elizabethkingia anophelis]|uniref:Uncharacterized protein n=1 Tax=Elizabethkingia anophelis TaxID=1117645 RepID=A0A7Z7LVN2_9FLAO|nr:hypothetical protein [Elizabethkingia anophelis]KMU65326.1 hypothetical protein EZBTHKR_0095 [Elizabethkingia anophelis]MCQ0431937.1 hypothetical protein [Elizabethkingia anophelis]MCS7370146.1 hypothetical protein [Elizabethkingia anophelis]MCS7375677.1 hypothetical protein [Elizabethkingia anophelis]MCS7387802.1 hypothetical protein [Elizabethkingia anophelis]
MKKQKHTNPIKKLTLDKLQVVKLNNLKVIKGGGQEDDTTNNTGTIETSRRR